MGMTWMCRGKLMCEEGLPVFQNFKKYFLVLYIFYLFKNFKLFFIFLELYIFFYLSFPRNKFFLNPLLSMVSLWIARYLTYLGPTKSLNSNAHGYDLLNKFLVGPISATDGFDSLSLTRWLRVFLYERSWNAFLAVELGLFYRVSRHEILHWTYDFNTFYIYIFFI